MPRPTFLARSLHTTRCLLNEHKPDHRASQKLFADAARDAAAEEAAIERQRQATTPSYPNWTGDERMEDTVLRMLVDKYKPLRGDFMSSEEKLRQVPPTLRASPTAATAVPDDGDGDEASLAELLSASAAKVTAPPPLPVSTHPGSLADVPLLPSIEGHRPWHTTYKAPSHEASVRVGRLPPSPKLFKRAPLNAQEEKALREERALAKRTAQATRIVGTRESVLDYKLGLRPGGQQQPGAENAGPTTQGVRRVPVSDKAWMNLVEERIEAARRAGKFTSLSGRHKPLERSVDEHNPFITRDEFLLNRLVQRQGAAPPWVEIQTELDSAVRNFRTNLASAWTRRALRNITLETPSVELFALAQRMTPESASGLRDPAWTQLESGYHAIAVRELNDLVRRYNALAPYTVRRGLHTIEDELERAYKSAGEAIVRELRERVARNTSGKGAALFDEDEAGAAKTGAGSSASQALGFWDLIREWWSSRRS